MHNPSSYAGNRSEAVFETTPFFSFHHINAFEASGGCLVVDTVAMSGIDFGNNTGTGISVIEGKPGKGVVTRLVIDGKSGKVRKFTLTRMVIVIIIAHSLVRYV